MIGKVGFVSLIAGIVVLVGYFMPGLASKYYLIPVGGGLAILAAIVDNWSKKNY